MATNLSRLTFVVTEEMEPLLASAKKERFYDRTRSDMIRELILTGLEALDKQGPEQKGCERAS